MEEVMNESPRPAGFQGYHRVGNAREDAELTHVGPGAPCGEYLRRYWQPVASGVRRLASR